MDTQQLEMMLREQMLQVWPGMPEADNVSMAHAAATTGPYAPGPYAAVREDVPHGRVTDGELISSIYPKSKHLYKLYVPAGGDGGPLPLMVFLDGISQYLSPAVNAVNVLDNLIAEGKIPAMAALFLEPGDNGDGMPIYGGAFAGPGSNRGREYDSVDDVFARFLDEEVLPAIAKDCPITDDPDKRGICGASSAANAAFCVAWHHTHSFRRVLSHIGSFVNIRGGSCNPDRIRKNAPKPIRIFLQDGSNDLNIIYGDWVLANKEMVSALKYRGYRYKYVLGEGGHNVVHGGSILPEALEWLWSDGE